MSKKNNTKNDFVTKKFTSNEREIYSKNRSTLVSFFLILIFIGGIGYFITNLFSFESLLDIINSLLIVIFSITFIMLISSTKVKRKGIILLTSIVLFTFQLLGILSNIGVISLDSFGRMKSFVGKSMTEVIDWTTKNKIELNQEYEYSDMIEEYYIISQDVLPGTRLKKVDRLTVAISEGPNPYKEVVIPNMVGWDTEKVLAFIKENHLSNVLIDFVQSEKAKDTVIEQSTSGNLRRNEEIKLVFSYGEEREYSEVKLIDLKNKTKFEALFYLKRYGIKYEIAYDFSDSITRGNVMSQSIKAGTSISINSDMEKTLIVTISKGPKIVVPDLKSMSVSQITDWVIKNKLKIEFLDRYDDSVKENGVLDVNYKKGDVLEQGSIVKVTISKGSLKMAEFTSLSEFREWADKYGISYQEQYEFSDSVEAGQVIHYSYKKGATIKNGDTIIVTISDGKKIAVPNLIGLTKNEASSKLDKVGLSYNFVYKYSDTIEKGKAISQSISAGAEVSKNTTITITLSNGKAPANNSSSGSSGGNTPTPPPAPVCDTSKGATFFVGVGNTGEQAYAATKAQNPGFTITVSYVDSCSNGATTSGMVCNSTSYDDKWISYCTTINLQIVR